MTQALERPPTLTEAQAEGQTETQTKAPKTSGNCGCTTNPNAKPQITESIQERIAKHPCYSEEAHHHYARMHVAVAPACNIQCNYCNRKYDCANESRPGVVSELLTPEEAAHKVLVIAGKIPQMTVLGIAGPGDPLANPEQTFRTFELIAEQAPDIKLCLSTNGLRLAENVDRIKQLNVDHVTITINMVDPEIGTQIYPWVRYNRKRVRGIEAARILHEQQMNGLQALKEADILCKVNSVMIPGINDEHLAEVDQVIREKGAFLHNIMPLISAPEHGTHFGLIGQRGPTPKELKSLQDKCADSNMKMMRHCRQCRADAVGLLGEDRSQPRIYQRQVLGNDARVRCYHPPGSSRWHREVQARTGSGESEAEAQAGSYRQPESSSRCGNQGRRRGEPTLRSR